MNHIFQLILDMPTPFNMICFIVLVTSFTGMVTAIASNVRKYCCHRDELELKRDLIESGMDADQINLIVTARGRRD